MRYRTVGNFSIIVALPSRHLIITKWVEFQNCHNFKKWPLLTVYVAYENTYATYAKVKRVGGEGVNYFSATILIRVVKNYFDNLFFLIQPGLFK